MIRLQHFLAHLLWSASDWLERRGNGLYFHPIAPRRITCWQCERTGWTLRRRELHFGPHGYKPVCRKCEEECPF